MEEMSIKAFSKNAVLMELNKLIYFSPASSPEKKFQVAKVQFGDRIVLLADRVDGGGLFVTHEVIPMDTCVQIAMENAFLTYLERCMGDRKVVVNMCEGG